LPDSVVLRRDPPNGCDAAENRAERAPTTQQRNDQKGGAPVFRPSRPQNGRRQEIDQARPARDRAESRGAQEQERVLKIPHEGLSRTTILRSASLFISGVSWRTAPWGRLRRIWPR